MDKESKERRKVVQDAFDRGFIKVLTALQRSGKLKNEAAFQREIDLSRGKIYEIKNGYRHVPASKKDKIIRYLMHWYDVNPNVFLDPAANIFLNDPPEFREPSTEYEVNRVRATAGDMVYLQRLEDEVKHLREENMILKKLIASLEMQLAKSAKKSAK